MVFPKVFPGFSEVFLGFDGYGSKRKLQPGTTGVLDYFSFYPRWVFEVAGIFDPQPLGGQLIRL